MDDPVRGTQSAAFYSVHSGQSRLVLNHIEPHYKDKDKVGSVPSGQHLVRKSSTDEMGVSNLTLFGLLHKGEQRRALWSKSENELTTALQRCTRF
jgi:hypothetical protein